MKEAAGEAKKQTASAISDFKPNLSIGVLPKI
jgi:hypothetical protein